MIKYSANLGFLWSELSLPDAIRAAKKAGFEAVECHWPYDYDTSEINSALQETGLTMLGLNTFRGDVAGGENGLSAVTGREAEARQYIDQACEYADVIGCEKIHVMAGFTDGGEEAENTFRSNLKYACEKAAQYQQTILIEPLNLRDAPGYHLSNIDAAIETVKAVGCDNIKVMFDCYHIQIMQGDLIKRLEKAMPYIGHIQIAGVPDRGEPDQGEVNYQVVLAAISELGYDGYIGAEYKPRTTTDAGLGWLEKLPPY
ncbi:hydroxypyruvate isomerase family protein [Leucothrix pacifica]|uniref:Isomerase n=1 Tax=Leucothrix pacifica TaxID=1247513 RepID=A0A317C0D8_9GAMM|nr:TIM barrel protein [Leucothrix pacifica]PWQ92018.1 isomerase [Leucothrix pacifica]